MTDLIQRAILHAQEVHEAQHVVPHEKNFHGPHHGPPGPLVEEATVGAGHQFEHTLHRSSRVEVIPEAAVDRGLGSLKIL